MDDGLRGEFEAWWGTTEHCASIWAKSTYEQIGFDAWQAATERARARLYEALQSDLENGVAWLNDKAADEFRLKYPALCAEFVHE